MGDNRVLLKDISGSALRQALISQAREQGFEPLVHPDKNGPKGRLESCPLGISSLNPQAPDWIASLQSDALRLGVERLVVICPTPVYQNQPSGIYREEDPRPADSLYQQTIQSMERRLLRAENGPTICTLRPALLYGPEVRGAGLALALAGPVYNAHIPALVGFTGGPRSNWVHLDDLARAALHLLKHGRAGQAYHVGEDDSLAFGDLLTFSMTSQGLAPKIQLPYPQTMVKKATSLLGAGRLGGGLGSLMDKIHQQLVERHELDPTVQPLVGDDFYGAASEGLVLLTDKICDTGFRPGKSSILAHWPQVLSWYQRRGWVPSY